MGAYYHLKALSIVERTIKVRVTIIDPSEEHFYDKKVFGLQYIWTKDHTYPSGVPPLLVSIPIDKFLNKRWMVEHVDEYVEKVAIGETRNYPASDFSIPDAVFFELEYDKLPQADYEI